MPVPRPNEQPESATDPCKVCDEEKAPMKAIFVCKQITDSDILCDKSRCFSSGEKVHCLTSIPAALCFMGVDLPEITSKTGGPLVKQFSVFLPNKVGALLDVV